MIPVPIPVHEAQRLAALLGLHVLDTPSTERFDRITRLVQAFFQVPVAAINVITWDAQVAVAQHGMPTATLPRHLSFCAHAIVADDILLVPDMHLDARFVQHPLVQGAPRFGFYAGIPLRTSEGHAVGTLCILDYAPRMLSLDQQAQLRDFAAWAERELTTERLSTLILRQQETEDALRLSEAQLMALIVSLSEGIVVQDTAGTITLCNASAERILGMSQRDLLGRTNRDLRWRAIREDNTIFSPEDHPAMQALRTGTPQHEVVMGIQQPAGQLTWIAINAQPLRLHGTVLPVGVVTSFVDITLHKLHEQHVTQQNAVLTVLATTDGLTGVLNKRTLVEQLAMAIPQATHTKRPLSVILLDVDHFKHYNDTYGHPAGDALLVQLAQLLQRSCRGSDLVARYGGEAFLLMLPHTDEVRATQVAERCRVEIAGLPNDHRPVTASVGVTTMRQEACTAATLIAQADAALAQAKRQGRNQVVRFPIHTPPE